MSTAQQHPSLPLVPPKPSLSLQPSKDEPPPSPPPSPPLLTFDSPYIHPALTVRLTPNKGRQVVATTTIPPHTTLLLDLPYALVPAPDSHRPPFRFCSNDHCHRRVPRARQDAGVASITCPDNCVPELIWCSQTCRARDIPTGRHAIECAWLRVYASEIREDLGEWDFELLWLLVRIFVRKHSETKAPTRNPAAETETTSSSPPSHFDRRGWDSVWDLQGSVDSFPADEVDEWRALVNKYLIGKLPSLEDMQITLEEVIGVICRIETNSFGLYPGVTGEYPITRHQGRGGYFGSGLYPTAAMFNHACCPNVSHHLDDHGRRIFQSNRQAISPGDECCISYFDLVEFRDSRVRREEIRSKWTFACDCRRCEEEDEEEDDEAEEDDHGAAAAPFAAGEEAAAGEKSDTRGGDDGGDLPGLLRGMDLHE